MASPIIKKKGRKKKRTQNLPNICKFEVGLFDASTCEAKLRLTYVVAVDYDISLASPYLK